MQIASGMMNEIITSKALAVCLIVMQYGCATKGSDEEPVRIESTHTNIHGVITKEIAYGRSDTDYGANVIVMPLKADATKTRVLVRVTNASEGITKVAWVEEGHQLLGFPGLGPAGARLREVKQSSAVFEFGFAMYERKSQP